MFLNNHKDTFLELQKFKLSNGEWDALEIVKDIMKVSDSTSITIGSHTDRLLCTDSSCFPTASVRRENPYPLQGFARL